MKIIIDAMGGDHAPEEIVHGAIDAAVEFGTEIVLVGEGETILRCLNNRGLDNLPKGIEIAHSSDMVAMEDDPTSVLKKHKDSSMVVGLRMLAEGGGDAFISAGNSGALLTAATLVVKRIPGVRRAAFAPILPTKNGSTVLIDCGANVECTAEFLLQFGIIGSAFAQQALSISEPRVALLNNGTEAEKGAALQKEVYPLLQDADRRGILHFIGNIESREALLGGCDVLVADGFTGNVFLKAVEGTALFLMSDIKKVFYKSPITKFAGLLCRSGISELKSKLDYRETGGTELLGLKKPVIKAHGSSDARAIRSAVKQAILASERSFDAVIRESLAGLSAVCEK